MCMSNSCSTWNKRGSFLLYASPPGAAINRGTVAVVVPHMCGSHNGRSILVGFVLTSVCHRVMVVIFFTRDHVVTSRFIVIIVLYLICVRAIRVTIAAIVTNCNEPSWHDQPGTFRVSFVCLSLYYRTCRSVIA